MSTRIARRGAILASLLILAITASLVAFEGRSDAATTPARDERTFVAAINRLRAEHDLEPLVVDRELTIASRRWAEVMAERGEISHAPAIMAGITQRWTKVGENVGVGGATTPLMEAFIASPDHLANLLDPLYTRVGVGVVRRGDKMFTTHRFMSLAAPGPGELADVAELGI